MSVVRETRRNLWIMAAVVIIAATVAVILSFITNDTDFKKTLQSASIALIFGSLLGGLIKLLLDDFDRGRQQRAEQAQFLLTVLADLKSVYDRTERAKVLISAHKSAKTYGDEMRDLIEARVKLLNVIRAVKVQLESGPKSEGDKLEQCVASMEKYLKKLIDEFQDRYKDISERQREYEAVMKTHVEKVAQDPSQAGESPDNEPWTRICLIESARDFLDLDKRTVETNYEKIFVGSLDEASDLLTKQLRRVLG